MASASSETLTKKDRIRLKNSKAQRKYRLKKQEEHRRLESGALELESLLSKAEADREDLKHRVMELQLRLDAQDPAASAAPAASEPVYVPALEGYDGLEAELNQGLLLRAIFQPPRQWTYAEAMKLSLRDMCEIQREMVLKAGQLLIRNPQRDPDSVEGQQLQELMTEVQGLIAYVALHQPLVMWRCTECKADTGEWPAEDPPLAFWISIMKQLRLSPSQEASLLRLYSGMQPRLQTLLAQREEIREALLNHIGEYDRGPGNFNEDVRHAYDGVAWARLVRAARDNTDGWLIECSKFAVKTGSLWSLDENVRLDERGLNIFQDAQLLTLAWPYWPRRQRLAEALARAKGALDPLPVADKIAALCLDDIDDEPYKSALTKMSEAYHLDKQRLVT